MVVVVTLHMPRAHSGAIVRDVLHTKASDFQATESSQYDVLKSLLPVLVNKNGKRGRRAGGGGGSSCL